MQNQPLTVLLIDDDEDYYALVHSLLCDLPAFSFELQWESSFEAAMEGLKQNHFDVCLLDYRLGGRNGLEFLEEAVRWGVSTPIIFLTGQGSFDLDIEAMRIGASGYLTKDQLSSAIIERSIRCAIEYAKKREELVRVRRVIQSLSECNNAVIRIKDELELVREICRIVVEVGGYRMASVCYGEQDVGQNILPAAQYGYLTGPEASTINWLDTEPWIPGTPIRTCTPIISPMDEGDSLLAAVKANPRGSYVSAVGFPLLTSGQTLGSLTVYASEANAFHAEDIEILKQVAGNLSYGIEALRKEHARKQAEEALIETEERLKEAHRLARIGIWSWSVDNDTMHWSEELYDIAGRDTRLPAPSYREQQYIYTPESWELLRNAVEEGTDKR
ncbi:MAG: response regulator [Syntrophobacteraceae bacterium]